MNLLTIDHVSKAYRRGQWVNDDISLSVNAGEVFGLLGPNGAGKTTLVNQIIGLVKPTAGQIRLDGVDIVANPSYARQACSFQPQSQVPIEGVTLWQSVNLIGQMRGGRPKTVNRRARHLIEALQIQEWSDKNGELVSGGVRRLTAFCMAAVVPGQLVILDEPTNDVDPLRRRLMWREVQRLAEEGAAVLLVTHNVLEAERAVDRLAIINQGRVLGAGTPASLKENETGRLRLELTLEPDSSPPAVTAFLTDRLLTGRRLITTVMPGQVHQAVAWAQELATVGEVEEYAIGPATLEDVYIRLVNQSDSRQMATEEVHHGLSVSMAS